MNAFEARMFIEQVLAQPSIPAAAQLVQANVRALDQVFFMVLQQMMQEAQPRSTGNWGGSVEDRIAEGLARIQNPTGPSQRLQALTMLHNFALQQCQQLAVANLLQPQSPSTKPPVLAPTGTPPVLPQTAPPRLPGAAKGFDYWLKQIQNGGASAAAQPAASTPEPLDDMAKARRLMEIDRRYLPMLADTMPGRANDQVIRNLESVHDDYERLARCGLPTYPLYTERDLEGKMADVMESLARAHDSLNHVEEARRAYKQAQQMWQHTGQADKARRCEAALARLKLSTEGNVDDEVNRLQEELELISAPSLAHVKALVELGELQSRASDDFAAEESLLQAQDEMEQLGYASGSGPSGTDLAKALQESLLGIMSGDAPKGPTQIETKILGRDLQLRILLALAQIYRESDPDKANDYLQRSKEMDSSAENEAFSDEMLKALGLTPGNPAQTGQ
jgi:hypothetical protein